MPSFLPPNYKLPVAAGGKYLNKFLDGDNRFRILGEAIRGNELWIGGKPYRKPEGEVFSREDLERADPSKRDTEPQRPKYFWMCPVIDMADQQVKILEITQRSVQEGIMALIENGDWGDPTKYDIIVKRSGKDMDTSYQVIPNPPKPLPAALVQAWNDVESAGFNLLAVFDNEDPFNSQPITIEDVEDVFGDVAPES